MSELPGRHCTVAPDSTCDEHTDRVAVKCIQGETDSFGAEYIYMCAECYAIYAAEVAAVDPDAVGHCSWGNHSGQGIRPMRDHDEGSSGPVYYACRACRTKHAEYERREYEFTFGIN